jgi:hypothetical protein
VLDELLVDMLDPVRSDEVEQAVDAVVQGASFLLTKQVISRNNRAF